MNLSRSYPTSKCEKYEEQASSRLKSTLRGTSFLILFILIFPFAAGILLAQSSSERPLLPKSSSQLIVVTSPNWKSNHGELRLLERKMGVWSQTNTPLKVLLGAEGMAWAPGLSQVEQYLRAPHESDITEWDYRSPAGAFAILSAFGSRPPPKGLKIPFLQITEHSFCVDDPESPYYSQIVDKSAYPEAFWKSAEPMNETEGYQFGLISGVNPSRVPDKGSCLFIHPWESPESDSAGCTVLDPQQLIELARRLDPSKHPLLVQLPLELWEKLAAHDHISVVPVERERDSVGIVQSSELKSTTRIHKTSATPK